MPTARERLEQLREGMMVGAVDGDTAARMRQEIDAQAQLEIRYEQAVFDVLRAGRSLAAERARLEQFRQELGIPLTLAAEIEAQCARVQREISPSIPIESQYAAPPSILSPLYFACLIGGAALAIYLYIFKFDDLSETQLMRLTPMWLFLAVFGAYGLISQALWNTVARGRAASPADAILMWVRPMGIFGLAMLVLIFPFLIVRTRNSLLTAILGSLIWGILLVIFFEGIWPHL